MPTIRRNYKPRGAALTFLELMIAATMVSVVALTVYGTLSNGLRVWQRINSPLPQEDVAIFFDKFAHDLRNSFRYEGLEFSGTREGLSLATLVRSSKLNADSVGKVQYFYDPDDKVLSREAFDLSDIYAGHSGSSKQILKDVSSLKILYWGLNQGENKMVWLEEWNSPGTFPLAVRLELELDDARQSKFVKTVSMPLSGV